MALKQSAFDFELNPGEENPAEQKITAEKKTPLTAKEEVIVLEDVPFVQDKTEETISRKASTGAKNGIPEKKSTRGRMKLSDMKASAELITVPDDAELFSKSYYSIGAVSDMFKVNQSLIRFWENEFDILKPKKNAKGDRFFRPGDVKNLKLIYHLLRERKYTIEGAKEFLKKNKHADKKFEMIESLKDLKGFLNELKATL